MKILLSTLNAKFIHSSLALRYLNVYCRELGELKIKEYSINNNLMDVLSDVYVEEPDMVCLACYIWNVEHIFKLASLIKKVLPNCIIVLGGPEVSYDAKDVLLKHSYVDYVVQGEGEEILYGLLSALSGGASLEDIRGLAWRKEDAVLDNGGPQFIENLNTIPFPYSDDDIYDLKNKIIYYETSRGCPFNCQYCLSSTSRGVRFFDTSRVVKELEFFIRHQVKQVKFVDRTYNINKEHFLPIMKFLAEKETATNFHFEITADLLDEEILAFLAKVPVGRFQFEIGVQSTNPKTLQHIGRRNNWLKIVESIMQLSSYKNIHLHLDLIAGLPYEDYQSFGKSFNDVYSLKPDMLQLGFLKLLKGSPLRKKMHEYKYIAMDNPPYEVLANHCLTYKEIRQIKILESVFEQVYNSGRFKATLELFEYLYKNDAFRFFNSLNHFWQNKGFHLLAHNPLSIYQHLQQFCAEEHLEYSKTCAEFLKFDAIMSSGRFQYDNMKDEYAEERSAFFHDEERVRKYIPSYKFKNWREVQNIFRLEVFHYDIPRFLAGDKILKEDQMILLFYKTAGTTRFIEIKEDDFNAL